LSRRSLRASFLGAVLLLVTALADAADPLAVIPPRAPGGLAVGCSNVEQDFSRVGAGETAALYWEGVPAGGRARYVTDLLVDPANTPTLQLPIPDDAELFGPFRNRTLPQTLLICYPTTTGNPYAGFPIPGGNVVPHMQRGSAPPIFADPGARYPLMLFSHGLGGSPLSSDYLQALVRLASNGYVVVAPFHADARIVDIRLEDLNDLLNAILNFPKYIAMQSIRPLALEATIDYMLASPAWAAHVDPARVVGFGASLGGESLMLLAGAKLTTSVGLASKQVVVDPRLKAAVGYVPYFGQEVLPSFGRDQNGVDAVTMPYLAISGTSDTTAPLSVTTRGMARLTRSRELVALVGTGHYFDYAAAGDIFTWTFTFLDGHVAGTDAARAQLQRLREVAGGGNDLVLIDYTEPAPPRSGERITVEFRNEALDDYFITSSPAEIAMLDQGAIVPGWHRTNDAFKTWQAPSGRGDTYDPPRGSPVCRFYGTPGIGFATHLFILDAIECRRLRSNPLWLYEGRAFEAAPAVAGTCAPDLVLVTRVHRVQNGQPRYRYLTSRSEASRMVGDGWTDEGAAFCTPP
jgi:predicted dienelactone hydrolase